MATRGRPRGSARGRGRGSRTGDPAFKYTVSHGGFFHSPTSDVADIPEEERPKRLK